MSTHVSHRDAWYAGNVQGVGFRAQVLGVARGYVVTGYVQNLADGRVYVHAEGDEGEVVAFIDQIARSLDGHIRGEEIKAFSGVRTCREFSILR